MNATIQKWGNSQAIRLPKTILMTASMTEHEAVRIIAEKDTIIIKKLPKPRHRTLKERLEGFNGEYISQEWDTRAAVGNELP